MYSSLVSNLRHMVLHSISRWSIKLVNHLFHSLSSGHSYLQLSTTSMQVRVNQFHSCRYSQHRCLALLLLHSICNNPRHLEMFNNNNLYSNLFSRQLVDLSSTILPSSLFSLKYSLG